MQLLKIKLTCEHWLAHYHCNNVLRYWQTNLSWFRHFINNMIEIRQSHLTLFMLTWLKDTEIKYRSTIMCDETFLSTVKSININFIYANKQTKLPNQLRFKGLLQTYSEPSRKYKMELFATIVKCFYLLTIFAIQLHHRCFTVGVSFLCCF